LGHALVLFDMIGENLLNGKVDGQMVWNTRWLKESGNEIWDALDEKNELLPTGQALRIWTDSCLERLCFAGESASVRLYTCCGGSRVNLMFLNKGRDEATADVSFAQRIGGTARSHLWAGDSPDDGSPRFDEAQSVEINDGVIGLRLPPVSLTIIALQCGAKP
jgi:hypothetical protein